MQVYIIDYPQGCLGGVTCVRIFQCQQVGVFEDGDEMVLQGSVDHPAIVVLAPLLLVLSEKALLLPGRRPFWDSCRSYLVGRADKGGVGYITVLLRRKHRWELLGNYRDFIMVMVFYLFCWRTKRILVTNITGLKMYILIQSLILFISENNRVIFLKLPWHIYLYIYSSR